MTTTPIISIPIDDAEFDRFAAAFEDYTDKLKEQPAQWQAMNNRIAELAKLQRAAGVASDAAWASATAAAVAYEKTVHGAAKAQTNLGATTTRTGTAMHRMATQAKAVRDHLFGAVRFLAKFSAYGVAGGLVGAGGLAFGLDDLAGRVLATQRTSRGLGLTSGQYNSFLVNMRQYAGAGILSGAANAQIDPRAGVNLGVLGIDQRKAQTENAAALAGQEIMAVHRAWRADPTLLSAQSQAALALGFTAADIRNIGTAHGANLRARIAASGHDAGSLGFTSKVAREWAAFDIQLAKAKTMIGSAFITALTPIMPQLTRLSREFADFIVGLEKSGDVKLWIGELATGLKEFATWLESPAFRADMKSFASSIAQLARETVHALRWLGLIAPAPAPHPTAAALSGARTPAGKAAAGLAMYWDQNGGVPAAGIDAATLKYSKVYQVPLDMLRRQAKQESSYGRNLYNPKSGEVGVMQVSASNYKALGITNPLDTNQDVRGGTAYDAALFKKYGSWRKALAAYDWGMGNLDKDIAAHGKDWLRYAPAETRNYVAAVMSAPAHSSPPAPHPGVAGALAAAHGIGSRANGSARPSPHSQPPAPSAGLSDLARVLKRLRAGQSHVHVTVHSPPGSRVFVSTNAAAGAF